ncbi:DsbA family oxidoreductase [Dactylosporangium fulvum]|uniref:DsbA family oxidoreductase n=1 Tax=Dactylosporangium fulvum TaxID=53359 RepID=A0ABY5W9D6_9ACTN|nr:DsbA family oxidoreductase [Dactylosporangium fulvum]UWP86707.1 DsbA family oxidoreductase [Dactylosporangium fulvum]
MTGEMAVEVHADVLCPWCYIGHRRLRAAVSREVEDARPTIRWRAYELAPQLGRIPGETAAEQMSAGSWWGDTAAARIARIRELGAAEGLELNLHHARPVSSFDAHRLVKLADFSGRADEVMEALFHGYHSEGLNIADHAVLERIGVQAGLSSDDIRSMLAGDALTAEVRSDERLGQRRGVTSVPSLVVRNRPPVSGVLSVEDLRRLINADSRHEDNRPLSMGEGPACE